MNGSICLPVCCVFLFFSSLIWRKQTYLHKASRVLLYFLRWLDFNSWNGTVACSHHVHLFITALHGMQTRSSDENSVSLCVFHTRVLWQNGKKICPNFYTIRKSIYPSFLRRWMVGGGATPSTWNLGSTGPHWSEIADFQPIFARSSSAVTLSKKVQLTLLGSRPRAFQWAQDEHRTFVPESPHPSQRGGGLKNTKCPKFKQ